MPMLTIPSSIAEVIPLTRPQGNGADAAVQIATMGTGLAMTNAEFVVI